MKKILTFITILICTHMSHAQNANDYTSLWKRVDALEQDNMTASAQKLVEEISQKAKKEKQSAQKIKALLHSSKYALTLEEDAQLSIIQHFNSEIANSSFPEKQILESYLANLYWQYFQQNRYQFYNRTTTATKVDSSDFRTWDLTTLFHEISLHFNNSLKESDKLQSIPVSDFKDIIHQQKDSEIYRPTLFDLLAHTALSFYKTQENSITRPADKFEINEASLLCEAPQFIEQTISLEDPTSLQAKALAVYQKLIHFHTEQNNTKALVDVDIERIAFIFDHATFSNKKEQYVEVLENSKAYFKGNPLSALYSYQIAQLYNTEGDTYNPDENQSLRWKKKEALAICDMVMDTFPESRGAAQCKSLKSIILQSSLAIQTEEFIPIHKAARLLVTYKNVTTLHLKAYKVTPKQIETLEQLYPIEKKKDFIEKLSLSNTWSTTLKDEKDYQTHTTDVLLPPLDNGAYIIQATTEGDKTELAYSTIQVTNIALVNYRTTENEHFQIIDRNSGSPLANTKATFTYNENYGDKNKSTTLRSDANGILSFPLDKNNKNNVTITVNNNKDTAYFSNLYVSRKYNRSEPETQYPTFLFTDRSIYRPGQPLYFKGISLVQHKKSSTPLEGATVTVSLLNTNGEEVGNQQLKTNDFGSFSGNFVLPSGGLTGNYFIQVTSSEYAVKGYSYFSVEEYKRPKFETSFNPIFQTLKVNDSVTVSGKATAYAGSVISDAKVNYTVTREVFYPRWYYYSRPFMNSSPEQIAFGETKTNEKGAYNVTFKALPISSADPKTHPVFHYRITADVTDINGETHSTSTIVNVGYHSLTASLQISERINKHSKEEKLQFTTQNLNGEAVDSKGTITIEKLQAPSRVLRRSPLNTPDYPGFSKEDFTRLFPHEAYLDEADFTTWKVEKTVLKNSFDTSLSKELMLDELKKWDTGKYKITLLTKDPSGEEVKDVVYTTIYDKTAKTPEDHQLFSIYTDKDTYSTGDKVALTLSSNAEPLDVTLLIEKQGKIVDTQILHLSKNKKTVKIPVLEEDLGGFAIHYSFSAYNEFKNGSVLIQVPYPDNNLSITTTTFRDKLLPGQEEKWTFHISAPNGDAAAAEVLASMYDASLDAFTPHQWSFSPLQQSYYAPVIRSSAYRSYGLSHFNVHLIHSSTGYSQQAYDSFNWFGLYFRNNRIRIRGMASLQEKKASAGSLAVEDVAFIAEAEAAAPVEKGEMDFDSVSNTPAKPEDNSPIAVRKNLQETAFFFPQLQTDKDGNVSFSFTSPEALTKWKLQLLAHTKEMQSSVQTLEAVTQKELMVTPNAPRFLREGDKVIISSKIGNLSEKLLTGNANLQLLNPVTNEDITQAILKDTKSSQHFSVDKDGNTQVSWELHIPKHLQAVQYTVSAKAGTFSDAEQNVLPVLSNRMLVTETLPMWVQNGGKTFSLDKLTTNTSSSLEHHQLTLEVTSNPAWYAVQALPYLMEYPYECNEQTFSRYYANTLASHIVQSNPRIEQVFKQWANSDALISNLEKNQELKALLIEETPWLRDAASETEQKKRIALLFNLNQMKQEQASAMSKLEQNQMPNGAWAWFAGGQPNRYITQHILTGIGHLNALGVPNAGSKELIEKAIRYADAEFVAEYNELKKHKADLDKDHLSSMQIHYLYMRSFYKELKMPKQAQEVLTYYLGQAKKYWTKQEIYQQGLLALVLKRNNDESGATKIITSLKENSIHSEEKGRYWKANTAGYFWYQSPIETQALLIEAFSEIENDTKTVDQLKMWLLTHKRTNQWKTTKATTEAVYALLLRGSDWISVTDAVAITVGNKKIDPNTIDNVKAEAGTGYFKTSWKGKEITPEMGKVTMTTKGNQMAWGGLYWQYFEDMDKITSAKTPLQLTKKLFVKRNTKTGEQLQAITQNTSLKVGDLVTVRIELKADRPMEFIHMKDMRAAGMEPINVLSSYKWQDGLGYYESTKDASTNFFIDYLPKGVFVFEYDVRVNNAGDFSNGITTIQSMYAPEFSSHSDGIRVQIQ